MIFEGGQLVGTLGPEVPGAEVAGAEAPGDEVLAGWAGSPVGGVAPTGSALDADDPVAAGAGRQLALTTFLRRGRLAAVACPCPVAACAAGFLAAGGFVACGALC